MLRPHGDCHLAPQRGAVDFQSPEVDLITLSVWERAGWRVEDLRRLGTLTRRFAPPPEGEGLAVQFLHSFLERPYSCPSATAVPVLVTDVFSLKNGTPLVTSLSSPERIRPKAIVTIQPNVAKR